MRISDWSSDVCSSDLVDTPIRVSAPVQRTRGIGNAAAAASRKSPTIEDDREKLTGDSRVILIVEDDAAFARILCDLAHETGFQCLIAETADEGVLMARQYLPHAVILDIGLPDHTGLSRSEEHTSALQSLMRISYA